MPRKLLNGNSLLPLLLVGALGATCWSFWSRSQAEQRLNEELANTTAVQRVAQRIQSLRQSKQRALLQSKPSDELNRMLDEWTRQVAIPPEKLVRIDPQEPRRVGDTAYLEQVTELEVFQVPLSKLVQLAQVAETQETGLKLASMRISPPRSNPTKDGEEELWNAELALTYLIYSPKSGRP